VSADGGWAVARQLRRAQAATTAAGTDAVSQDPDRWRQREANRLQNALEDTGSKLDCVASDILGKSGRAMRDALVSDTTDPEVLAELAQGLLRKKLPPCAKRSRAALSPTTR
jgi:hypothetical protein